MTKAADKPKTRVNLFLRTDAIALIDIAALSIGMSRSDFMEKGALVLAGQPHLVDTPAVRINRAAAVLAEASTKALEIMSGK